MTETPTIFDIDKTLTASSGSVGSESHIIHCNTQSIIPGMQVTGSSFVSCSSLPFSDSNACYPDPYFQFADVRVVSVDHVAGTINLTEANVFTSGDILNFSTITHTTSLLTGDVMAPECICKEFTVSFTGPSGVDCRLDHQIDFTQQAHVTPLRAG